MASSKMMMGDDSVRIMAKAKKVSNFTSYLNLTWRTLLAVAAALDFMATVLPGLLRTRNSNEEDGDQELLVFEHMLWEDYEFMGHPIPNFPFGIILKFLNRNCGKIGFAFSMLWFLESFLDASRTRDRTLRERDRERLLAMQKYQAEATKDGISCVDVDFGYMDDNYDSWIAFYLELVWQLMLLPVGFYLLLSQGIYLVSLLDGDDNGFIEKTLRDTYDVDELTGTFTATRDMNLALGVALVNRSLEMLNQYFEKMGIVVKTMLVKEVFHFVRKTVGTAVLHPRKFATKMKNTLAVIRWIKYLQPIIATANKLRGNMMDLIKKYRQRKEALILQKVRRSAFQNMSPKEQREYAAKKLQSKFRAHQVRRKLRALKIMEGKKEVMAAIKMQAAFRRKLERARVRIKQKKLELEKLQAKAEMEKWNKKAQLKKTRMSPQERMRLYELEEEFHKESVRVLHQRMLMKPNTRFAVTWKIIFCTCVIFEITGLIVNPFLKNHKIMDDISGEPLTVDKAVKNFLIPQPVEDLDECKCQLGVLTGWKSRILGWRNNREADTPPPDTCDAFAWYCEPPYSTARSWYILAMNFMVDEFFLIVGLVVFLDVPISFFTGEFDESTGALIPKPWFTRWILPGLVLQFLVNPQMASTTELLGTLFHHACEIGPVRVWRWTQAFFYPLFIVVFTIVEQFWMITVRKENHQTVLDQARSSVVTRYIDPTDVALALESTD